MNNLKSTYSELENSVILFNESIENYEKNLEKNKIRIDRYKEMINNVIIEYHIICKKIINKI